MSKHMECETMFDTSNMSKQLMGLVGWENEKNWPSFAFIKTRAFEPYIQEGQKVIAWGFSPQIKGNSVLSFDHKKSDTVFRSLTEYAWNIEQSEIEEIADRLSLKPTTSNAGTPPSIVILVEDASPDSCLAFLILLYRAHTHKKEEKFIRWIEHISHWELFGYDGGVDLTKSYGALHNALVHSFISTDAQTAWNYGLSLLIEQLERNPDPRKLDADYLTLPFARMAVASYEFEVQSYNALIENSETVQLRLPSCVHPGKKVLIDALLCSEDHFHFGTHKALLRTDKKNAELKSGFSLMALFRTNLRGTGNDITISTDAYKNLTLRDLWEQLEKYEDQRWEGLRPYENPRHGMTYAFKDKAVPNQPWYIDRLFSLIAAPMDPCPTKLGFKDVTETLWREYHPLKDIPLHAVSFDNGEMQREKEATEIENMQPVPIPDDISARLAADAKVPKLFIATWQQQDNSDPGPTSHSTIGRILCARIRRGSLNFGPISLAELPPKDSFEIFEVNGNTIVISDEGAFILLKRRLTSFKCAEYIEEFWRVCGLRLVLEENLVEIRKSIQDAKSMMEGKKGPVKKFTEIFNNLAKGELSVLSELSDIRVRRSNPNLILFRDKLMHQWGTEKMVNDVASALVDFKSMITVHTELLSNRRMAALTRYGFPLVFFAGFFEFVIDYKKVNSISPLQWLDSLHIPGLIFYLTLSGLGMLFVWALQKYSGKKDHLAKTGKKN